MLPRLHAPVAALSLVLAASCGERTARDAVAEPAVAVRTEIPVDGGDLGAADAFIPPLDGKGLILTANTAPIRREATPGRESGTPDRATSRTWNAPPRTARREPAERTDDPADGDGDGPSLIRASDAVKSQSAPGPDEGTKAIPDERNPPPTGSYTTGADPDSESALPSASLPPAGSPAPSRSLAALPHLFPLQAGIVDLHISMEVLSPTLLSAPPGRSTEKASAAPSNTTTTTTARAEIEALFETFRASVRAWTRPKTTPPAERPTPPQNPDDTPASPAPGTPKPSSPPAESSRSELADNDTNDSATPPGREFDLAIPDLNPMIDTPPGLKFGVSLGPDTPRFDFGGE